jgi:hypothetical protein
VTKFNLILDFAGGVLSNKQGNWGCKLSTPAVAAEFSVVVPVGFFDQEWVSNLQENKQKIPVYAEPVLAACQQPQRQECGGGAAKKATKTSPAKIQNLVQDFKDIFSDTAEMPAARHGVLHHISTSGQPVSARYRRLDARHLEAVFGRIREAGLLLNREKCVFAEPVVDFLGHRVSQAGIAPLQSRVEAVRNFPKPATNKQLMSCHIYNTVSARNVDKQ